MTQEKKERLKKKKSQVNCPALDFKWREKRWQIVRSVVEAAHRSHAPSIARR
jgi:orotidine-5'-phosphate decarboxylase